MKKESQEEQKDSNPPEKGIWRLISPSGKEYRATSPLRCCRAEIDERVPIAQQFERLVRFVESKEPPLLLKSLLSGHDWIDYTEDMEDED